MRITKSILCLFFVSILIGCEPDKIDSLEGKWLLKEITYVDKSVHAVDSVWYNFQNTLFMYQFYDAQKNTYFYRYGFKWWENKDLLKLTLHSYPGDIREFLPYTDWETDTRFFKVERKKGKELILSSEGKTYSFCKF